MEYQTEKTWLEGTHPIHVELYLLHQLSKCVGQTAAFFRIVIAEHRLQALFPLLAMYRIKAVADGAGGHGQEIGESVIFVAIHLMAIIMQIC